MRGLKGKPWGREEERELMALLKAGKDLEFIAEKMDKTVDSIKHKVRRLGLLEGPPVGAGRSSSGSEVDLPSEFLTVEDAVKILGEALLALRKLGISRADVDRWKATADVAWKYKIAMADLVDYRKIQKENVDWRRKYEELVAKETDVSAK